LRVEFRAWYSISIMDDTRTQAGKEARRRLAVQKVNDGWSQKDVADFLGVHPVTVNKWVRTHRAHGDEGLARAPHPGRTPFLTPDQEQTVLGWLRDKPTAHGFHTDLWTARRVAELIRRTFAVEYHPNYLREWMAKRKFSPQKPTKRAKERDLVEVGRWLAEDWPAIQKRGPTNAPTSS
jgi:transposase